MVEKSGEGIRLIPVMQHCRFYIELVFPIAGDWCIALSITFLGNDISAVKQRHGKGNILQFLTLQGSSHLEKE